MRLAPMAVALGFAIFGAAGCGSDDEDDQAATPSSQETSTDGTAADAPTGDEGTLLRLAVVPSPGKIAFDKKRLTAKAGKVTIELVNEHRIGHNVRIQTGSKCCFRPGSEDIGGTDTIDNATTRATLDLKPGKYIFLCSLGGHWQRGQWGKLTVN